jgi:HEAT repeat protein
MTADNDYVERLIEILKQRFPPEWDALPPIVRGIRTGGHPLGAARRRAVTALGEIGGDRAFSELVARVLDTQEEFDIRNLALRTLVRLGDRRAIPAIIQAFGGVNESMDYYIVEALGEFRDTRALDLLMAALDYEDPKADEAWVATAARTALVRLGPPAVLPLIEALRNVNKRWRAFAAEALGQIGDERALPALIAVVNDEEETDYLRWQASTAIGQLRSDEVLDVLRRYLERPDVSAIVRWGTIAGLGYIGTPAAVALLITQLDSDDRDSRREAVAALSNVAQPLVVDHLTALLADPDPVIAIRAIYALGKIGDVRAISALQAMPPGEAGALLARQQEEAVLWARERLSST